MDLICDWKERVESRINPRLWTSRDGDMELSSTWSIKSPTFWSSALGATTMSSVFLLLSLRRLGVNHDFISERQLIRD